MSNNTTLEMPIFSNILENQFYLSSWTNASLHQHVGKSTKMKIKDSKAHPQDEGFCPIWNKITHRIREQVLQSYITVSPHVVSLICL